MIRLIEECMGHSTFPFTTELLKDSLRLYLSAYGQVCSILLREEIICIRLLIMRSSHLMHVTVLMKKEGNPYIMILAKRLDFAPLSIT